MNKIYKGKVKWFNVKKGYGFISYIDDGEDKEIFVHYSQIISKGFKKLEEYEDVEFEIINTSKGIQAACVYKV